MNGQAFEITSKDIVQYLGTRYETYGERIERRLCCWLAHHAMLRRLLWFVVTC